MNSSTPCLDEFDRIVADLRNKAANSAARAKPTMWAYYGRMADALEREFADSVRDCRAAQGHDARRVADGGLAGVALAICGHAESDCPNLDRDQAADLWALSVYCDRILRKWITPKRRSLAWLRNRAEVRRA